MMSKLLCFLKYMVLCSFFNIAHFSFAQIDSSHIVVIGSQTWTNQNFEGVKFKNGDSIQKASNLAEWNNFAMYKIPAYATHLYGQASDENFGFYYNWFAINDPRGLAPDGWKIPSKEDALLLLDQLGFTVAKALKSEGYWESENCKSCAAKGVNCGECASEKRKSKSKIQGNGTNSSGFNAIPSGFLNAEGVFERQFNQAVFWLNSTVADSDVLAYCLPLQYGFSDAYVTYQPKELGFSVRLIKIQ